MLKRLFIPFLALLVFSSCGRDVPEEFVQPEQMKVIVWDVIRADELASINSAEDTVKTIKHYTEEYYSQVFTLHHISRDQFYKSYDYYLQNPLLHKALIDSVYAYGLRANKNTERPPLKLENNQ